MPRPYASKASILFAAVAACLFSFSAQTRAQETPYAPTYGYPSPRMFFARYFNPALSDFSVTVDFGSAVYDGDLSSSFEPGLQNNYLNPHLGVGVNYRLTNWVSANARLTAYTLYSEDQFDYEERLFSVQHLLLRSEDPAATLDSLQFPGFRTVGAEFHVSGQLDLVPKYKVDNGEARWVPYVWGGAGFTYWEVYDKELGSKLRDANYPFSYGDDDLGEGYADFEQFALVFPVGGGVRYYLYENLSIGVEVSYRFTQTNFLDGHADRVFGRNSGESTKSDAYSFFSFRVENQLLASQAYHYKTPRYYRNRRKINRSRRRQLQRKYDY